MRTLTRILALLVTLVAALLWGVVIDCFLSARGRTMGNEEYGFYSFFLVLALLCTLPAAGLWYGLLRKRRAGGTGKR
ncbi:hypothetical protein [Flaviaesturariibacter amylovorans]|uniref:Uncharacterized protein n=1 Tax=Flaviaesturariibacter amylovorans TaxID=1084520 RepID=A0ABP8HUB4_9BACT